MITFIKRFSKVYKDWFKESNDNDKDKIKFKRYNLSNKRLNQIKKYVKKYKEEELEYINLTIEQYKKHNNDFLNAYLNKIYYHYYNYEKKILIS